MRDADPSAGLAGRLTGVTYPPLLVTHVLPAANAIASALPPTFVRCVTVFVAGSMRSTAPESYSDTQMLPSPAGASPPTFDSSRIVAVIVFDVGSIR